MSAYDNPTIIKNDAALIWGQAAGGFAESFKQSFDAAKKDREAKAKESKEAQLNKQLYASNTIKLINAEAEQSRTDLTKAGAPSTITDQVVNFSLEIKNMIGENDEKIKFDEVDNAFIENNAKLQSEYNNIDANMKRMLGEGGSQIKAGAEGVLNQTNISNIEFRGNTDAQRLREFATYNSSVLNKDITPALVYDKNKLSNGVKINIKTTGYNEDKLKNAMKAINPSVAANDENWQTFIKEAKEEGILEETIGEDNKKNYTIIYDKPINAKTRGDFYVTVPEAMKAKDLETAGIYDNKGGLYDSFLGSVNYIAAENNAGLKKSEYEAKIESRTVKMDDMMALVEKKVNANIAGMLSVDFTDTDKLRGFMTSLEMGTSQKMVDEFLKKPLAEQIKELSGPIIKKYKDQIIKDNNIVKTKDKSGKEIYAQVDRADVTKFTVPDKTPKGLTDAQREAAAMAAKTKSIIALVNDDDYKNPIESPDGNRRISYTSGVGWVAKNKSGGNWVTDLDYSGMTDKKELAKEFLGL